MTVEERLANYDEMYDKFIEILEDGNLTDQEKVEQLKEVI